MAEFESGNYELARHLLKAVTRNSEEELALAYLYQQGLGGSVEIEKALKIYELLSSNGNPQGMYYLGTLFLQKRDLSGALLSFEKAANMGHISGAYWSAAIYDGFDGFPRDEKKYLISIKRASELGHLFAIRDVARIEMHASKANILRRAKWFLKYWFAKIKGLLIATRNPQDLRLR
jgi:TPR repeat protein